VVSLERSITFDFEKTWRKIPGGGDYSANFMGLDRPGMEILPHGA